MSLRAYWMEAELARLYLLLQKSYDRQSELSAAGEDVKTLTNDEFELCNGKPHKDPTFLYHEPRQVKDMLKTLRVWFGMASTDDETIVLPKTAKEWKNTFVGAGRLLTDHFEANGDAEGYPSDNENLDDVDGSASEAEEDQEADEEED